MKEEVLSWIKNVEDVGVFEILMIEIFWVESIGVMMSIFCSVFLLY